RSTRDTERANSALESITTAASADSNLLPHILRAVESNVTVGEISQALRAVWGEYREAVTV
ncbi:MAG: methylmalonyl-CoA mutase family protein, partial [Acidobacteriota bacterium]|nr:methylmalonyl-CoA mutase family protein [Acidobacteriota bacterium]